MLSLQPQTSGVRAMAANRAEVCFLSGPEGGLSPAEEDLALGLGFSPVTLGRRLRDAARPGVRWVEIEGGSHSRLHQEAPVPYRQALQSLIQTLAPAGHTPATPP